MAFPRRREQGGCKEPPPAGLSSAPRRRFSLVLLGAVSPARATAPSGLAPALLLLHPCAGAGPTAAAAVVRPPTCAPSTLDAPAILGLAAPPGAGRWSCRTRLTTRRAAGRRPDARRPAYPARGCRQRKSGRPLTLRPLQPLVPDQ